jgi:copper oxidase (laccase) domain-containing protein
MQTMLEILTHPLLRGVKHGFFTRKGGASSGLFSGLNCGRRSTDQTEMVTLNRARVATAMGVPADALATVKQVHSADVITLAEGHDIPTVANTEADGIVTTRRGVALAVLTADCQPILWPMRRRA